MKKAKGLALLALAGGLLLSPPLSATERKAKINASLGVGAYLPDSKIMQNTYGPLFELRGNVGVDWEYIGIEANIVHRLGKTSGYADGEYRDINLDMSQADFLLNFRLPLRRAALHTGAGLTLAYATEEYKKNEEAMFGNQDPFVTYQFATSALGPVFNFGVDFFDKTGKIKISADVSKSFARTQSLDGFGGWSFLVGIGKRF